MTEPRSPASAPVLDAAGVPPGRLREIQETRLRTAMAWARRAPFWAERLGAARDPGDIAAIAPATKRELVADQERHGPYGSTLCVAPEDLGRVFSTSGTTGRPLIRALSARDWGNAVERVAENYDGLPRGRPVLLLSPSDAFGAALVQAGAIAAGSTAVMAGRWSSDTRARYIAEARPVAIAAVPSYLLHLADVAERAGLDLPGAGVELLVAFGEPGASDPRIKAVLRERYGARTVADGYGMTETGPVARGCPDGHGLHFYDGELLAESLVPGTSRPAEPGDVGELVLTTLQVEAQPLVRYRTGDLIRLAPAGRCSCGSWARRTIGSLQGRSDEMIWYRGINLFPAGVASVLAADERLGEPFELVVEHARAIPDVTVRVECAHAVPREARDGIGVQVSSALRDALGVELPVVVEPPGTLPPPPAGSKPRRVRHVE